MGNKIEIHEYVRDVKDGSFARHTAERSDYAVTLNDVELVRYRSKEHSFDYLRADNYTKAKADKFVSTLLKALNLADVEIPLKVFREKTVTHYEEVK